ncbi:sigma-54-dependent transcriptional regulator [Planctomycetota bacterium]
MKPSPDQKLRTAFQPSLPVLVVDDEPHTVRGLERVLRSSGITDVNGCSDSRDVMSLVAGRTIGCILLDLFMPHIPGEELLMDLTENHPGVPVIVVTGATEVDTAIRCMKGGAFDYMVKPVEEARLISAVQRALELRELRLEFGSFKRLVLSRKLEQPGAFAEILTNNSRMHGLFQYVEAIAGSARPVLITGETGVGKELLAKAVHRVSRPQNRFVAVNIAGFDDAVFADTLFGHLKGAFTGADRARGGLVESASGGSLFLDEIGDLSLESQVKLLRLIEERDYLPLGADATKRSDARIIVATNRDLQALQANGRFRTDLYYRLQTRHVQIPPLRERLDDLPLLVDHFFEEAASSMEKKRPTFPRELLALLASYHFPGNVRELQSMVYDAVSQHRSRMLSLDAFKEYLSRHSAGSQPLCVSGGAETSPFAFFERLPTLTESTRLLIAEALGRTDGSLSAAAQLLGISRSGLGKAVKRHGIVLESMKEVPHG